MKKLSRARRMLLWGAGSAAAVIAWMAMGDEFTGTLWLILATLGIRSLYLYSLTRPSPVGEATRPRMGPKAASMALWLGLCMVAAVGEALLVVSILGPDTFTGGAARSGLSTVLVETLAALHGNIHGMQQVVVVEWGGVAAETLWMGPERSHAGVLIYMIVALMVHAALTRTSGLKVAGHALLLLLVWIGAKVTFVSILIGAITRDRPSQLLLLGHDHAWGPVVLAMVLALAMPRGDPRDVRGAKPGLLRGAGLAVAAALIVIALSPDLLPAPAGGRVLVDDSHSREWQPASPAFDDDWTAANSPYNFSTASELLGHHFDVSVNESEPLDELDLGQFDVLILKIPEVHYSRAEILALVRFVEAGGGVLLLGDHTDLMRSGKILNTVAEHFDLRIANDSIMCREGGTKPLWKRKPWDRPKRGFSVDEVSLLTAGSIEAEGQAALYGRLDRSFADVGRPDAFSHFGDMMIDGAERTGPLAPIGLSGRSKGRVAAFADGTILTSFAICRDNRFAVLLNLVNWLNCRDRPNVLLRILFASSAILLLLGMRLGWVRAGTTVYPLLLAGALAGSLAAEHAAKSPEPAAVHEHERVAFFGLGGTYALPDTIGATEVSTRYAMDTGFTNVYRLGLEPYWMPDFDSLRPGTRAIVLFNPTGTWSPAHRQEMLDFVRGGGSFVVFHCSSYSREAAVGQLRSTMEGASGGSPWNALKLPDGRVSARKLDVGKGMYIEAGDSCFFSRERMGHCFQPVSGDFGSLLTCYLEIIRAAAPYERVALVPADEIANGGKR